MRRIEFTLLVNSVDGTRGEIAKRLGIDRLTLLAKIAGRRGVDADFLEFAKEELA